MLLESLMVCLVEQPSKPHARPVIALNLSGRVNHTKDQAEVLFLMDEDGAALLVSQLLALGSRIGPDFSQRFLDRIDTLAMEGDL